MALRQLTIYLRDSGENVQSLINDAVDWRYPAMARLRLDTGEQASVNRQKSGRYQQILVSYH
jgi:hypothetical protein